MKKVMKKMIFSFVVVMVISFGLAQTASAEVLTICKTDNEDRDCTYNEADSKIEMIDGVEVKIWDCYGKTGSKCCGDDTESEGSNISNTLFYGTLPASFTFEALDSANLHLDAGDTDGSESSNFVYDGQAYTRLTEWSSSDGIETITITIEEFIPGM